MAIDICDTGSGISSDGVELLFRPFERFGKDRNATEGTGLGLALSKHLMEAMGGGLELVDTSPQGTRFSVRLPLAVNNGALEEMAPTQAMAPEPSHIKLTKVLCIEDNPQSLSLIENVMTRLFGCGVIPAMLGELGLALAAQHKPDVILLDLDLPDMSGLDVLRELRSDPGTAAISVVVISADATEETRQKAMAAEATTYLTKPLDLCLFITTLEDIACS